MEDYYAEDIVQIENSDAPIQGKTRLLAMEVQNFEGVHAVETKLSDCVIDEATASVWGIMTIRFHSKKLGKKRLEEAFLQKWKDGKIIYQRFFYKQYLDDI